jgi:Glycosyl hydrolase family 20, catalytic domain
MRVDDLFSAEQPVLPVRGVHLDLKGVPPTPERLTGLLDVFAAARFNAVLVEWEDIFPWTVDERFRCETAYSPEEVRAFAVGARERGIEIIPLVQCIGHMETFLSVPGYEPLREVPESPGVLNVLADGAGALVQSLVDDVLALLPDVKRFHLGGDEAWTFGSHPDTKAYIDAQGKGALYMQHVGPILDRLAERGIRPILWHDMMIEWDSAALKDLAARADLCVWGYRGHPDQTTHHFATRHIQRFAENGVTM